MPRQALSKTKASQIDSEVHDKWIKIATERCIEERRTQVEPRGVGKICKEVEEEYFRETKKHIHLSRTTVDDRVNGRQSIRDFNMTKRWLDEAEEAMVVDFTIDTALRGFPLNHKRLKEHVDVLCRAKYGDGGKFPKDGVGRAWTQRFVERHSTRLHPYWSRSLDHSRARAVNPTNIDSYFSLLKSTIEGKEGEDPIEPDCIYGMDETGLQLGVGTKERVIGPTGRKVQYQQRSGNRENVTVLVTICADGTSVTPAVIFKGDAYHPNWDQPNPGNAALAHSKKGYTDGEISVEWIKLFHRQTEAKARGRRRLLLVDGHSSHYTFGFLEFAREHHIHVLCYPSHTTHILQGLDVAIFGSLKHHWTTARDEFERAGKKVNKTNFLSVYHTAHTKALTIENIIAAFRKTGVVPFDPGVIQTDTTLPSLETSIQGSLPRLRAVQTSPIRVMTRFLLDDVAARREPSSSSSHSETQIPRTPNRPATIPTTPRRTDRIADVVATLTETSAAYLVSPSPIPRNAQPPRYIPTPISPMERRYADFYSEPPKDEREERMQAALRDADARDHERKKAMVEMQGAVILSGLYVGRVQEKVEAHEEKAGKGKGKGKLLGDGLPKLLDGDDFHSKVVEHNQHQEQGKAAKAQRKVVREKFRGLVKAWQDDGRARSVRVKAARASHKVKVAQYEAEMRLAKRERRAPRLERPELRIEPRAPKPKLRDLMAHETDEDEEDGEDEEEDEEDEDGSADDRDD